MTFQEPDSWDGSAEKRSMGDEEASRRAGRAGLAHTAHEWGWPSEPRGVHRSRREVLAGGFRHPVLLHGPTRENRHYGSGLSVRQRVRGHGGPGEHEARQSQLQPADNVVQRAMHVAST
jgi:hypothetical protein